MCKTALGSAMHCIASCECNFKFCVDAKFASKGGAALPNFDKAKKALLLFKHRNKAYLNIVKHKSSI